MLVELTDRECKLLIGILTEHRVELAQSIAEAESESYANDLRRDELMLRNVIRRLESALGHVAAAYL